MEERIPRKHNLVVAILHEEADAVLGVAGRVQRLDGDAANVERLAVLGRLGNDLAVRAADDLEGLAQVGELSRSEPDNQGLEVVTHQFLVSAGVVPVTGRG